MDQSSLEKTRKKARLLEGDIDAKLVCLNKLASSNNGGFKHHKETEALLSPEDKFESMCSELDSQLSHLTDVNEGMNAFTNGATSTQVYIIQRHRDLLQDYRNEFLRVSAKIKVQREREVLLGSSGGGAPVGGLSKRELHFKESNHLSNSERMIDEQISIAMETHDHMKTQRATFKLIQTRMNDLSNKFPLLNNIMTRIDFRKRRDSIILGSVVGLCLTFLLWWML